MKQIKNLLKSNMYGNLITHFQLILNNFAHLAFISNCLYIKCNCLMPRSTKLKNEIIIQNII